MRRCGTTEGGCNGKTGTYAIDYVIPDAPYVRYRYPTESWKNINGTRFETIQNSPTPGQGVGVTYRVGVYTECEMRLPRTVNDCPGQLLNPKIFLASRRMDVLGPIGSIAFVPWQQGTLCRHLTDFGNYGRFNVVGQNGVIYGLDTGLNYFRSNEPTTLMECITDRWEGTRFFYKFKPVKSFIERADGKPETGQRTCTFKVFNWANQVILEQTRDICPEAVTVPSTYGNNKGSFRISNNDPNKFLRVVRSDEGAIKVASVFLGNVLIQKLLSPVGSLLYPRVCWDCAGDEKCPPGTCEVKCKNHICCFDSYGRAVKTIKK
ncbi:MAG: hypothetical protein MUD14_10080 [Hydrococcus sp. Prado102]|jgi:hypothetical protein|nr:hypothetical protein [Hydrococcus sp. Prado102]